MKITLPNGVIIEHDSAIEVAGTVIAPIVYSPTSRTAAAEPMDVSQAVVESGEKKAPAPKKAKASKATEQFDPDSLPPISRDLYLQYAQYSSPEGVHYSDIAEAMDVDKAHVNSRSWMLVKRELLESTGGGKFRVSPHIRPVGKAKKEA